MTSPKEIIGLLTDEQRDMVAGKLSLLKEKDLLNIPGMDRLAISLLKGERSRSTRIRQGVVRGLPSFENRNNDIWTVDRRNSLGFIVQLPLSSAVASAESMLSIIRHLLVGENFDWNANIVLPELRQMAGSIMVYSLLGNPVVDDYLKRILDDLNFWWNQKEVARKAREE